MIADPTTLRCVCPSCGERLWRRRSDSTGAQAFTLANRILKVADDGAVIAKCTGCGGDVPVTFLRIASDPVGDPVPAPVAATTGPRRRMVIRTAIS